MTTRFGAALASSIVRTSVIITIIVIAITIIINAIIMNSIRGIVSVCSGSPTKAYQLPWL